MGIAKTIDELKRIDLKQEWLDYLDELIVLAGLFEYDGISIEVINNDKSRIMDREYVQIGYRIFIKDSKDIDRHASFKVKCTGDTRVEIDATYSGQSFHANKEVYIERVKMIFKEWI